MGEAPRSPEAEGTQDLNTPEIETLARYLDGYRAVVVWKLEGLDEEQVRRRLVPSVTTLLGIVKHLGYAERFWFQHVIAGRDVHIPWHDEPDADADWALAPEETTADVIAFYEAECEESRRVLTGIDDPEMLVHDRGQDVSVRRILIHMVEETARHAGHADILRELVDGRTGGFPGEE